jgi:hypothetical protein
MNLTRFCAMAVVSSLLIGMTVIAADPPAGFTETPIAAPTPATATDVAGWVRDLESNKFPTRRTAMRMLLKAGSQAVAPVAAAADTDELELASRCISILKTLYQSENAVAKGAAEEALKRLSKSERASVAQRATDAVKKPAQAVPNFRAGGVQIRVQLAPGGGIQIARAAGLNGRNVSIRQTTRNGNRETDVEIDGKKIRITDSKGQNIVVKVSEKVGGKAKNSEYKAKDLAELKKKHPEAAKLYEQYATGQNNIGAGIFQGRIKIIGGAVPVLPLPIRAIPFPGGNPAQRIAAQKQIAVAQQRLNQAATKLKELAAKGNTKPDDLKKLGTEIESAIQQLKAAQKQLAR